MSFGVKGVAEGRGGRKGGVGRYNRNMKLAFNAYLIAMSHIRLSIGNLALLVVALLNEICFVINFNFYYYLIFKDNTYTSQTLIKCY